MSGEGNPVVVDLFGDPVRVDRDRRGRPEHVWSKENSNKINLLFATGHELKDAAAVLGISVPTLRKHYFSEVEQWRVARLRLTAKQLLHLNAEAEKGNVGAIKEIFKRMDRAALIADGKSFAKPAKAPKRGKKEERHEAARSAHRDSSWGELVGH